MALEWEPLATPRRGYETEFLDLLRKLAGATGARREQLLGWLANTAIPAYETLGAPRVGHDEAADAWLLARAEKSGRLDDLDEIQRDMHGYHVLDLLPPCDGFPVYSRYRLTDDRERYSFHAELLSQVKNELGVELCERAYEMLLPEAHVDFAERLFEVADKFAADHALPEHVATIREPVFPEGTDERRGHILYAAAKWCAFWSMRGHGLAASY